jgi:lysophospholipase L1-like esterase
MKTMVSRMTPAWRTLVPSSRDREGSMRVRVVLAAVTAAAVLAGTAEAAPRYTALGDSYAAGPLIPLPLPPFGCLKSSNNYGHIAQRTLRYAEYRDATCSGAETEDMTRPQNVSPGPNPPQFDLLSADTRLVTINIGGNDIGFSELAENCVSTVPWGSRCKDRYVRDGRDEISDRIAATAPKVAAVIQGIRRRSPDAEVLVLNYSAIFPHTRGGCYPRMPVARGDVAWLRDKHVELNAMLARQAAANGAELVDVYAASVGRDACASSTRRWVEPYVPATAAAPLHPNLRGMQAMAAMVVAAD